MTNAIVVRQALRQLANPEIAQGSLRYFKTGKGEYAYADKFLGIRVPVIRKLVRGYPDLPLTQVLSLLTSVYHEERLLALLMLVHQFEKGDPKDQKEIFHSYLNHTAYINNWDLVDSSAYKIVGAYLADNDKQILYQLCDSKDLWERRIAIISTLAFIRQSDFADALEISFRLLTDQHDLIHKAVGWMLREIGNRDRGQEKQFLNLHYQNMPRTMLRYAIEKFPEDERQTYLKGKVNPNSSQKFNNEKTI